MRVDGAVNGDVFAACLNQVPGPTLRPGDVVGLDNWSVHQVEGLAEIVQKYGGRLRYPPPYSPDFNPIKNARQAFGRPSASSKRGRASVKIKGKKERPAYWRAFPFSLFVRSKDNQ